MTLRWDWLAPEAAVPYVPALGPVAPAIFTSELLRAVSDAAGNGEFLPCDKDRRWFTTKHEHYLTGAIISQPGLTIIPTLTTRDSPALKIHIYSRQQPDPRDISDYTRNLPEAAQASRATALWFQDTPPRARTRVMIKTFDRAEADPDPRITTLDDCPHAATFEAFARDLEADGFSFLNQRIKDGHHDGPILVITHTERIAGAIGPLSIMTDPAGTPFQPSQYFAVHPARRGCGYGRALWRASMAWGAAHGAAYKILQAASGTPAERLYLSEGLTTLGFTRNADIDV